MVVAWGFSQGTRKMRTGKWFQGSLLIQPYTAYAKHGPARETSKSTRFGTQLPLPCPPPGKEHTVMIVWH